jgi:hypothetical protein
MRSRTSRTRRADAARGVYVCTADYEFAAPVDRLDVECAFHAVTVPNHVHLLRAQMGGKWDQAVFDLSFPRATLRFRPPTPAEIVATEAGAGFIRALGGLVQVLFLAALTVAYLAVEILFLPRAGARWLVAGVLGGFHGLYFHFFVQTTGYRPGLVLAGAAAAELIAIAILALRPLQVSASALLVFGMVWFFLRLRN